MPAVIDLVNVAAASSPISTSGTVNVTCGASDNGLLALIGSDDGTLQSPPTSVTYNAVSLAFYSYDTNGTWGALENVNQPINPLSGAPAKYQGLQNFIAG